MNQQHPKSDDAKLADLLRESRPAPSLPPRFQENVWRRIDTIANARSVRVSDWLDSLAASVLRPRLALATAAALVVAGALLGAMNGSQIARRDAQHHYLAAVAPEALR